MVHGGGVRPNRAAAAARGRGPPMLAAVLALVSALPPPPPSPSLPLSPMARLGLDDWAVGLPQVPLVARWSGTMRLGGARRPDKGGAGRWRRSQSDSVSSVGAGLDGTAKGVGGGGSSSSLSVAKFQALLPLLMSRAPER
ncbi:hypothetical protein OsJ_07937 [Oryza sativa Japonica Group]|uniref:Uncharacterized protein n=1 Tax=Oryza sativa subsp. japonica TaxID=39947 RepID=B9F1U1_ORYSJ|nr:hypothetical protein OsJ_07937 [Oryza sativa Japonica Group]